MQDIDGLLSTLLATNGLALVLAVMLPAVAFIYLALRIRELKAETTDLQLGLKTAYHFFHSCGVLTLLLGMTILSTDLMKGTLSKDKPPARRQVAQENEGFTPVRRTGVALMASGTMFSMTFLLILVMSTNDGQFPFTRRAFVGMRLTLAGTIVLITLTSLSMVCLSKSPELSSFESLLGVFLVWVPTLVLHLVLLRVYSAVPRASRNKTDREASRTRREDDD